MKNLVRDLKLTENVVFTGVLGASEVARRMCSAHVFVLSSLIENSPNTLAEAMILGVPSVSSFAGGAQDMARDGEEALFFRAEDPAQLAFQIRRVFEDDDLALRLSKNARRRARVTHDPEKNLQRMLSVYRDILGTNEEE